MDHSLTITISHNQSVDSRSQQAVSGAVPDSVPLLHLVRLRDEAAGTGKACTCKNKHRWHVVASTCGRRQLSVRTFAAAAAATHESLLLPIPLFILFIYSTPPFPFHTFTLTR